MANTTIYPFGQASQTPSGIWTTEMAKVKSTLDLLAPWAFRETPNASNPAYHGWALFPVSSGDVTLRYGVASTQSDYIMSPVFDLGEAGDSVTLRFSCGETVSSGTHPGIIYFDEDMLPYTYHVANSDPRSVTVTVSSTIRYCRLMFKVDCVLDAYLYDETAGAYLFQGSQMNLAELCDEEDFLASAWWKGWGPNSRGDWIGWNFANSDSAATAQRTAADYPIYRDVGASSTSFSYSVSKLVALPTSASSVSLTFSCGTVDSGLMLRLLNPSTGTANYYSANANPRTVTVATPTYTHVQLYFLTANYADCYIYDETNSTMLWEGASSTD